MPETMKKVFAIAMLSLFTSVGAVAGDNTSQGKLQQFEKEAKTIISKMTIDEKISQLMNEAAGIPHLGIKPYNWWNEALHGVARSGKGTVFPEPICTASSFDADLVHSIGEAISYEGRAKYNIAQHLKNYSIYSGLTFWSPNVNIFRDPRWGRGMETYGEDPYLSGCLGTAFVKGLQGDNPVYLRVSACAKHFAVHSGPEATRHSVNVNPTKHDLYETYLPAFKMLVQKGHVESVMGAYNALYGYSCSGSKPLLTDLLRKDWGFKGHIVSDCDAVNDIYSGLRIAKDAAEASSIAIKAGLNLNCGTTFEALKDAYQRKLVTEKDLDNALLPLMMTRLRLGILEPDKDCPYNDIPESVICSDEHRALARRAATESLVLLKNDGVLPLSKSLHKACVLGPAATDLFYLMGNYYGISDHYTSYLEGITKHISAGSSINYKQAFNASFPTLNDMDWSTGDALAADYTIIFLGINGNIEGEEGESINSPTRGDRASIELPESQLKYFRKLVEGRKKAKNNKLIAVVCGGSPIDLREIAAGSDAVIMAWYPGQEGGEALGDLMFGDASFSGRLPITFPNTTDSLPAFDDYSMKGRTYKYMTDNIQYPFGYGLTYGKVKYSDATATLSSDKLHVSALLTNTSDKACDELAQVYLYAPGAGETTPISQLVAFKRVHLDGNSSAQVDFDVDFDQLKTVQEDGTSKFVKGEYTVYVGGAAPSARTVQLGVSSSKAIFRR